MIERHDYDMLHYVPCNLCGEKKSELKYKTNKLNRQIVKCSSCGLLYVNPQNAQSLTYDFEENSKRQSRFHEMRDLASKRFGLSNEEICSQEEDWRILHFANRAERVLKYRNSGRLLDIGCARGLFLANFLDKKSFDISGIEPRHWICEKAAKRLGNRVFCGTLTEAKLPDAHFDVVTMINLIEHLPSPKDALLEVNRIMKKGALLMVETPDAGGFLTWIMGGRWFHFLESEHNYFFTKATINDLLSQTGFKIISIESSSKLFTLRYLFYQTTRYNKTLSRFLVKLAELLRISDKQVKFRQPDEMIVFAQKS